MGTGANAIVPLAMISGLCLFAVALWQVVRVARRHRWRGDVRPRATQPVSTLPWRANDQAGAGRHTDASTERWGETVEISVARFRAPGQFRWHQAVVFIVNGGQGLVVDPYFSWSRRYLFDDTCHVGPTNAVMTFASGAVPIREFSAIRVADGRQTIDLAVRTEELPAIMLVGQSSPVQTTERLWPRRRRTRFVEYCDRVTARRRELARLVNARSRVHRPTAAACSLGCLGLAAATAWFSDWADSHLFRGMEEIGLGVLPLLIGVVVFGLRAVRPKAERPASE